MSSCDLPLVCSTEGGELFDRIQKKGHFTERGTLVPRGEGGGEGEEYMYRTVVCVHCIITTCMSPGNTKLRSMCKSDN